MKKILIIGATSSSIAQNTARLFAQKNASFYLVARNKEKLDIVSKDLTIRGAKEVFACAKDLNDFSSHRQIVDDATRLLCGLDVVLIAHGMLPDQQKCQQDFNLSKLCFETNFLSTASLLELCASQMEKKETGVIAVISSVAGDRGRLSNYIYGSAKGALTIYLQGLRQRLQKKNISVITIKPGFVDTPMTAGLRKGPLFASSENVGAAIYRCILKRKDSVYIPWFWQIIMSIIKTIPESLFKKASL